MIHYLIGDATRPTQLPCIISHVNNDVGGWGRGFVVSLSRIYPEAEASYRQWFSHSIKPSLGDVQILKVADQIHIGNMVAQHGIQWQGSVPPIRYDALEECLMKVYSHASTFGLSMIMPRIGAVLSGGHWPIIENIIKKTMSVETYIYTLENQKNNWPTKYEN